METELKLLIAPQHAQALRRHPLLKRLAQQPPQQLRMEDAYYDSAELLLWRAQAGLRVRRVDEDWVQTLKAGGAVTDGLHQREEWETPTPGSAPDLARLAASPGMPAALRRLLRAAGTANALQVLFTTRIERTVWNLVTPQGDRVELVLDRGTLRSGRKREAISEIELELKSGSPHSLYGLALQLQQDVPLRLGPLSKAQRGFSLFLDAENAPPQKASAVRLERGASAASAMQHILHNCLAHMLANEDGATLGLNPEYLHQLRIGLRRLRAALAMFKKVAVPPPELRAELQWLANALGPARDWDVLASTTLRGIGANFVTHHAAEELGTLQTAAAGNAAGQRAALTATLQSARYAGLMLALAAWIHGLGNTTEEDGAATPPALLAFAQRQLRAQHLNLLSLAAHSGAVDADTRHRLRVVAKKLRYGVEFFQAMLAPGWLARYLPALAGLQDALGALNDAAVAERLLQALTEQDSSLQDAAAFARGYLTTQAYQARLLLPAHWRRLQRLPAPRLK